MWIKRSLVVLPVLLLLFLLQSIFWVPGTQQAADNEGRLDRLVWYLGANPEDMNIYQSTSANDSDISAHLNEGLLQYDEMYQIVPHMADTAVVNHEVTMLAGASVSNAELLRALEDIYGLGSASIETVKDWKLKGGPAWEAAAADPALAATRSFAEGARQVRVYLMSKPRKDRVASAVDPSMATKVGQKLGASLHDAVDAGALLAKLDQADKERLAGVLKTDVGGLPAALGKMLTDAGFTPLVHNPIVEMNIRKGIHWVDGPFWGPVKNTWLVTVDGNEADFVTADSELDAIKLVTDRLGLATKPVVTARNYVESNDAATNEVFGEKGGPWWGRGPQFTSRDIKRTVELLKDNDFASPRMSTWADVKEVRTFADPHRVQVVYGRLFSPALSALTGAYLPYHHWNDTAWTLEAIRKGRGPKDVGVKPEDYKPAGYLRAKSRDYSRKPSSMGPMVLYPLNGTDLPLWQNGKLVRLMRNEFYVDRKPEYKWIDYYIFSPNMGRETAEMVFNTGGIDLYGCDPHQVRRYEQYGDRYYVIKRQTTTYAYLGFNTEREPVSSPLVRRALAMALDVDKIIDKIAWGQGERISGPGYPVLPWYDHNYRFDHKWRSGDKTGQTESLKFVPFNVAEAKALLVEDGYDYSSGIPTKGGKALELTITMHPENPIRKDIVLYAQQRWQELGIKVKIEEHEWNVYLSQFIRPRNFTVCVLGWSGGLDFDKRQLWHSKFLAPRGLNFAGFKNAEADKVMDDILLEYDFDKQVQMSHRMFKLIADELPYIFLYSGIGTTVVDPRVVWRREVEKDGKKMIVDSPLTHDKIRTARAPFGFWMHELKRVPEKPQWKDEDYRN